NVHPALVIDVAAMVEQPFHEVVLLRYRLQLDHRHIAALGEIAILVQHIGDTTRHAGREVASGPPDDHDDAAGHIFTAMVADTLHDGGGPRIAHGETLASDTAEIGLA